MDCMHASEILSAARDGEHVSPGSVAQAREHCEHCAGCAALLVTMERVADAPRPRASEQLITRIIETVQEQEAARVQSDATTNATAPTTAITPPLEPVRPHRRVAPTWWQPRFTPIASAAVVVLAVSALSTYMLVQMTRPATDTMTRDYTMEIAESESPDRGAGLQDNSATDGRDAASATVLGSIQSAPSYVVWNGSVWVRTDGPSPDETDLSAAGTVVSDLGESEGSTSREALTEDADPGAIFVRASDEGLIRFTQVTRMLGGRTYALAASAPISTFGTWPTLPSQYPAPTADDGSPVFISHGLDDSGREVFVPVGTDADDGFAVAPGTSPGDAAAGNPNWTWWEPID